MAELDEILGKERFPLKIGGKTYKATRLTAGDLGEFRAHVKEERIKSLLRAAKAVGMEPISLAGAVDKIMTAKAEIVFKRDENGQVRTEVDDPILSEMQTENGMRYLVYLAIRREHPRAKPEDIDVQLGELEVIANIVSQIAGLSSGEEPDAKAPLPVTPTEGAGTSA